MPDRKHTFKYLVNETMAGLMSTLDMLQVLKQRLKLKWPQQNKKQHPDLEEEETRRRNYAAIPESIIILGRVHGVP